jgi:hypothetical protein
MCISTMPLAVDETGTAAFANARYLVNRTK